MLDFSAICFAQFFISCTVNPPREELLQVDSNHLLRKLIIIALSLSLLSFGTTKRDNYDTNAKMKALYLYNFTKYIEWPAAYKQGSFVIGVVGESPLSDDLDKMALTKKAANQSIEIRKFASVSDIAKCHMLILPRSQGPNIPAAVKRLANTSTLVISEEPGLAQRGSGINFVVQNNKLEFELHKTNIEKYDLKVSSALVSLAVEVY